VNTKNSLFGAPLYPMIASQEFLDPIPDAP